MEDVDGPTQQGAGLVPAVVVGRAAYPSRGGSVVLQLPHGVVVEAESTDQVDPKWIARLLRELETLS
jgi:hypothetical protein